MNKRWIVVASVIIIVVLVGSIIYYQNFINPPSDLTTLTMGTTDTLENLDVTKIRGKIGYLLSSLLYDRLAVPGYDNLEPQLWIAEDITSSADGLTWTVDIREGVKFHDGTSVNATAVKFCFDRYIENGTFAFLVTDYVESIDVLDEYRVAFTLKQSFNIFPKLLMNFCSGLASPTAVQKLGEDIFDSQPVGCGPWEFSEWLRGDRLVLTKNTEYWNEDYIPKFDRLIIRFYAEPATLKMALLSGEVDIAYRVISPMDVPILQQNQNISSVPLKDGYIRYLCITQKDLPLSNVLVREAIAHAINRSEIVDKALKGMGIEIYTPVVEDLFQNYFNPAFERFEYNTTKAMELLSSAGYPSGITLTLEYTPAHYGATEVDVALLLKEQLAKAGITVNLVSGEWASYVDDVSNHNHMSLWLIGGGAAGDYCDPISELGVEMMTTGWVADGIFYNRASNDALFFSASASQNATERQEILKELQTIEAEDIPVIPLFLDVGYVWYRNTIQDLRWPLHTDDAGLYIGLTELD